MCFWETCLINSAMYNTKSVDDVCLSPSVNDQTLTRLLAFLALEKVFPNVKF